MMQKLVNVAIFVLISGLVGCSASRQPFDPQHKYTQKQLQQQIDKKVDLETFFAQAPQLNPNVSKITGVICGYRVEEIEDKLMQKIRYMDKLIDELAKGKAMEKILRK